jgi:DNA-binding MarR family transcriptional regulator
VAQLVTRGLVERTRNPDDARLTVICITPSGAEMQGRIKELWQAVEGEFQQMHKWNRVERDLRLVEEILRKWRSGS